MIIGFGKDIHNLIRGKKIILGGVEFDSQFQIDAYSDGDIILHTLSNAILSALNLDDIGVYFSNQDSKNKNLNSKEILDFALQQLKNQNFNFQNIVLCITCQKIKINPLKIQILNNLEKKLTPYFENKVLINLHATSFENKKNNQIICECFLLLNENIKK